MARVRSPGGLTVRMVPAADGRSTGVPNGFVPRLPGRGRVVVTDSSKLLAAGIGGSALTHRRSSAPDTRVARLARPLAAPSPGVGRSDRALRQNASPDRGTE